MACFLYQSIWATSRDNVWKIRQRQFIGTVTYKFNVLWLTLTHSYQYPSSSVHMWRLFVPIHLATCRDNVWKIRQRQFIGTVTYNFNVLWLTLTHSYQYPIPVCTCGVFFVPIHLGYIQRQCVENKTEAVYRSCNFILYMTWEGLSDVRAGR